MTPRTNVNTVAAGGRLATHAPRPTQLRPGLSYALYRTSGRDLHRLPSIRRLVAEHDEEQVMRRSIYSLRNHTRSGEMILLYAEQPNGTQLVGAAIAAFDHGSEILEIAHTVVHRDYRGERLSRLLSAGAIVGQALSQNRFTVIILTLRPDNAACMSAAQKLGAIVVPASDALGSNRHLDDRIRSRQKAYFERRWDDGPMIGIVTREGIIESARLVLRASFAQGLRWDGGTRVRLAGEWYGGYDPSGEGVLPQLRSLAKGRLPLIAVADAIPRECFASVKLVA